MRTFVRFGWLLLGLIGLAGSVRAQLTHALRLEIATSPDQDEAFDVVTLGERGALLTTRLAGRMASDGVRFQFQRLTTDLKALWTTEFKQNNRLLPVLDYHNDQYLFWLFREPDTDNIQIIRVNIDDGLTETFSGKLLSYLDIQQFKVMGNVAYIGGTYHNRPVVMTFSFFDHSVKVLPGLYSNHLELNSLEINEGRREVHVLVHTLKRQCQFSIHTYSADGKPVRTVDMGNAEHSLISGKLVPISEQESLVIGNYSTDCTPYSQGIYVTRIHHNETGPISPEDIHYIAFSQLKNFFNYLKPRQHQRLLARVDKRQQQGKDFKFRYRLLVHTPLATDNGLTLVAEVYYPQYRGTDLPYYGGMRRSMGRYIEGFRYTHAFICGFNKQGDLLWDNCLAIKDLNSPDLLEMVQASQQGDTLVLAYPQEGEINTEVIRGDTILSETQNYKLQTNAEGEKVLNSNHENLSAWYGHYFLACGFQKIAPGKGLPTREREVFYINKLTYTPGNLLTHPDDAKAKASPVPSRKTSGSGR